VPGYLDAICRKPNTDRWPIPLQLGIALASQCLLSYRRGRGDVVVGASLSTAEARTLAPGGGQDASPTARSLCCRGRIRNQVGETAIGAKGRVLVAERLC